MSKFQRVLNSLGASVSNISLGNAIQDAIKIGSDTVEFKDMTMTKQKFYQTFYKFTKHTPEAEVIIKNIVFDNCKIVAGDRIEDQHAHDHLFNKIGWDRVGKSPTVTINNIPDSYSQEVYANFIHDAFSHPKTNVQGAIKLNTNSVTLQQECAAELDYFNGTTSIIDQQEATASSNTLALSAEGYELSDASKNCTTNNTTTVTFDDDDIEVLHIGDNNVDNNDWATNIK